MRKIAILGTAQSSIALAPYNDPSWEIWNIGANQIHGQRFDRWFELHTKDVLLSAKAWDERLPFLKEAGDKLFIGHPCVSEELPNARMYPLKDITDTFGNYFTSTVAWMIALAIYEGVDQIGLWGVDMIGDLEYSYQRSGCEYMLGIAKGRGIKIVLPSQCPLLRAERMYGFEFTRLGSEISQMNEELDRKISQLDADYMKAFGEKEFYRGQQIMLKNIEMRWG